MSGFPSLPLFVREYLVDTTTLTLEQSGAYLHLLMHAWVKGGSLPDDERQLAAMAKVSVKRWRAIWPVIASYWQVSDGALTNKRLSQELQYVTDVSEKRRAAGARGGRPRSEKNQQVSESPAFDLNKPGESTQTQTHRETAKAVSPRKRGSRLPDDWLLPREWGVWAMGQGLPEATVRLEADKFRDYWNAKSGREATKLDWLATWRNWVRMALERQPHGPRGGPDQKLETWGIGDAKPVRLEPGTWRRDTEASAGAADLPRVQREPEGSAPEDPMSFGDANGGWTGGSLPSLRLVCGGVL